MKKLFTLTLVAFIGLTTSIFAQRHCDLSASLHSPTPSLHLSDSQRIPINVYFTNHGPDAIKPTDTIHLSLTLNGNAILAYNLSGTLAAGDSAFFGDTTHYFAYSGYKHDSVRTFCAIITSVVGVSSDPSTDPNSANNSSCSAFTMTDVHDITGLVSGVTVYPNPATSVANFSINLVQSASVSVSIFDVTGRLVATEEKGKLNAGANTVMFNTSNLSEGMYMYRVNVEGEVKTGKLYISK